MHAQRAAQASLRQAATTPRVARPGHIPLHDRRERLVTATRRDLAAWLNRITTDLEGPDSPIHGREQRDALGALLGQADSVRRRIALTAFLSPGPALRSLDQLHGEVQSVTRGILRLLTSARDTGELAPVITLVRATATATAHRQHAV